MISDYRGFQPTESFGQWLNQVINHLNGLHFNDPLTEAEQRWLLMVWDRYDLSVSEVAQAFLRENFSD